MTHILRFTDLKNLNIYIYTLVDNKDGCLGRVIEECVCIFKSSDLEIINQKSKNLTLPVTISFKTRVYHCIFDFYSSVNS